MVIPDDLTARNKLIQGELLSRALSKMAEILAIQLNPTSPDYARLISVQMTAAAKITDLNRMLNEDMMRAPSDTSDKDKWLRQYMRDRRAI